MVAACLIGWLAALLVTEAVALEKVIFQTLLFIQPKSSLFVTATCSIVVC